MNPISFFFCISFFGMLGNGLAQNDTLIKKQLRELAQHHVQKLIDGDVKGYIKDYDKNYIHIDGGRNNDGTIDFKFEKRRLKKLRKKIPKGKSYEPIGTTEKQDEIKVLNYSEITEKYGSINKYGFVLQENDFFVFLGAKREDFGTILLVGIYRKIKKQWKLVAGDF